MTFFYDLLQEIAASAQPDPLMEKYAYGGLSPAQIHRCQSSGYQVYKGKVRELLAGEQSLYILHSDRLSAFDRYIGLVPFKGAILSKISEFWLRQTARIMPVHFISAPQERILQVERLTPFKIEVIVRGYMTGSMERAYLKGERLFCGQQLPEGLTPSCRLSSPLLTPTTKAAVFEHDENISADELIARGVCSQAQWDEISGRSLELFALGQKIYREKGWILVDTKYEFGYTASGEIKVIDEVHTPDSSRLWVAASYEERVARGVPPEMLDKEIIRRTLMAKGFSGEGQVPYVPHGDFVALALVYLQVAETLTGERMVARGDLESYLENAIFLKSK